MDYIDRAIKAHCRHPGCQQPASHACTEEKHGDKEYVVLRNTHGVIGVYRLHRKQDRLRRVPLLSWPRGVWREPSPLRPSISGSNHLGYLICHKSPNNVLAGIAVA